MKTIKQYNIRVKVRDSKEEMAEYLKHAESIRGKLKSGVLVIKDEDPTIAPSFKVEYPKFMVDGCYFINKGWSEIVDL